MDPVLAASTNLANLSNVEQAQQARQRDGVRQADAAQRAFETQPVQPGRAEQTAPVPVEAGGIPALRPADLTQQARFALTSETSAQPGDTSRADTAVRLEIGDDPAAASNVARDSDALTQGDRAQPQNVAEAYGSVNSAEQAAQYQQIAETVSYLQSETGDGRAAPQADNENSFSSSEFPNGGPESGDEAGSAAEQVAERTETEGVTTGVTSNDPAGPILPRGSTLSLVA